ncbi:NUDIX domain-containing protein [Micromonospora sp. BRA006-A]|uniref:NUDIX domain-containing protein n=1 Tax=Micromonospora sp. BRA006-A TaxID=2962860 RepID=UPI00296E883D|nr:NUDIX domain-containing protein [Micromonospora sp. BRA006-A]MDW3844990.1 NUDIX domain-containing protein [Micromonospora sp. BRA006-A]MEE3919055.1 NUDIX domain-containing protein [Micromonospora sp. BRA006-A]
MGGGIDFGETAEAAVRRELREELDVDLLDVRLLGVLENLFHAFGRDGHEIVFVFDCRPVPIRAERRRRDTRRCGHQGDVATAGQLRRPESALPRRHHRAAARRSPLS